MGSSSPTSRGSARLTRPSSFVSPEVRGYGPRLCGGTGELALLAPLLQFASNASQVHEQR